MGREKEAQIRAEDNWMAKANAEGYACSMCGVTIPYCDREVYFSTGMCGHCDGVLSKDD